MTQEKKHSETGQDCPEGYKSCDGYKIPKEWHIVRFDSLFSRVTRKNDENNQNVLTISAQQGLISQIEYYNTLYASENKTGYTLLHRGDFSYNKSYSSGYAYGAIKRLDAYEKGIVSPLYLCFTPRQGVNSDFYLQYFEAGCFDREIYKIAQEGARNHGLLNVSTEDFFHSMLVFPPLEEQERITEILTQCDHVIELKEQKLDELKQLKKEFLRKMFPAKGCDTPEIRFPGFTGAWEQHKLIDVCDYVDYRGKTPTKTDSGNFLVTAKNIKDGYIDYKTSQEYISEDDYEETMHRGKPEIGELVGKCILSRHIVRSQITGTYQQGILFFFYGLDKFGDVRSKMLPVRINGNGIAVALPFCVTKSVFQRGPFPLIDGVGNDLYLCVTVEYTGCLIRRTVIDDEDIRSIKLYALYNRGKGLSVIVARDDNDDSQLL